MDIIGTADADSVVTVDTTPTTPDGWTRKNLQTTLKGDKRKIRIAKRLRDETTMTLKWIAEQLHMGTWTHVANRLYHVPVSILGTDPFSATFGSTNETVAGNIFIPQTPENFFYDADGNLTNDGRWFYTWDAENRLTQMIATNVVDGARRKLDFEYDYESRRVRKTSYHPNSAGWTVTNDLRFVYDGWNLVAELNATNNAVVRSYVWGSDVSESMKGAGVGGLISMTVHTGPSAGTYFYAYDGNGNIKALINSATGTIVATYDYSPFGELIRAAGLIAFTNPFRFSTKFHNDETDVLYYGYRHYSPTTGRWLNRDPIGELGGQNLHAFHQNDLINSVDIDGTVTITLGAGSSGVPWGDAGPAVPPSGTEVLWWTSPQFEHPPNEGEACCTCPARFIRARRTDARQMPTRTGSGSWNIHMGLELEFDDTCEFKDLVIAWVTCLRIDNNKGVHPGCMNSFTCDFPTALNPDNQAGPYLTHARIRYLSCENGTWKAKVHRGGVGLMGQYTYEYNKRPPVWTFDDTGIQAPR